MSRLYAFGKPTNTVTKIDRLTEEEYQSVMAQERFAFGIDIGDMETQPQVGWWLNGNRLDPAVPETGGLPPSKRVIDVCTQMEKNDKVLQCVWGHSVADATGMVQITLIVPGTPGVANEGRWVAYGDCEFETRHIYDRITKIEVVDVLNLLGYGEGAVVKTYHEGSELTTTEGSSIGGGMTMTYQYGTTEIQPVGGYGFIPAGFALRIAAQKGNGAAGAGCKFTVSVDWAKYEV